MTVPNPLVNRAARKLRFALRWPVTSNVRQIINF